LRKTGIVARVARERFGDVGHVIGIDISSDMLAVAPGVDWREGNVSALPVSDGELASSSARVRA
jgi:ubiquinone/menaquinone biosynthesis C-methylase UbiE